MLPYLCLLLLLMHNQTLQSVSYTHLLGEIVKANTYDAKVTRNVNLSGIPENETNVYVTPEKTTKVIKPKAVEKPQPKKEEPKEQPAPEKDEKLSWEK